MIHISASLLAADYAQLGEQVRQADLAGVDSFHFDMMDAHYVPNLALTPQHLTSLRPYTCLPFNVHLELACPLTILDNFPLPEAELIILQADTLDRDRLVFEKINRIGARTGLSLNPQDSLTAAAEWLQRIDWLVILCVYPGFGGQTALLDSLGKVSAAKYLLLESGRSIQLAVDGGINADNASAFINAGANTLIIGSALFSAADMKGQVEQIRANCQPSSMWADCPSG